MDHKGAGNNGLPAVYYDKIYKKEYLPSRIRYNQFFFFAGFFSISAYLFSKRADSFNPRSKVDE